MEVLQEQWAIESRSLHAVGVLDGNAIRSGVYPADRQIGHC